MCSFALLRMRSFARSQRNDNKISRTKKVALSKYLSWLFPRETVFLHDFLYVPNALPPLKRKFYSYCRLAVSDLRSFALFCTHLRVSASDCVRTTTLIWEPQSLRVPKWVQRGYKVCTPRGSCNNTLLRRGRRRFSRVLGRRFEERKKGS